MPEDNPESVATAGLTIDELAREVGMTVRNLREWRTLGLLPRAEIRGRVGYYDAAVVERVKGIQRLHTEGFTLELIRRMLEASGDAADDVMQLAGALRAPFRAAQPSADAAARVGAAMAELDMTGEEAQAAGEELRAHADAMAAVFERIWRERLWEPFLAQGGGPEELAQLRERLAELQPLALEALVGTVTEAMDARIERSIAREVQRAPLHGGR